MTADWRQGRFRLPSPREPIECVCARFSPRDTFEFARRTTMWPGGLASNHIDHYLRGGGLDYVEDLRQVLLTDAGVRRKISTALALAPRGCVSIEQDDYSRHDFQYAFGAIDRMDYQVLPGGDQVRVWFRDRYEWHPESPRVSNCVHRAAVELKDSGAQDYWMIGTATVPLRWLTVGPTLWERLRPW